MGQLYYGDQRCAEWIDTKKMRSPLKKKKKNVFLCYWGPAHVDGHQSCLIATDGGSSRHSFGFVLALCSICAGFETRWFCWIRVAWSSRTVGSLGASFGSVLASCWISGAAVLAGSALLWRLPSGSLRDSDIEWRLPSGSLRESDVEWRLPSGASRGSDVKWRLLSRSSRGSNVE